MSNQTGEQQLRLTERRNPRSTEIDLADPLGLVDLINAEDATVPAIVAGARVEIAAAVSLIEESFRAGGRLFYVGAGTSGRLGVLDASECPPTFGTPPDMVQGIIAGGLPALVKPAEGAEDDVNAGRDAIEGRGVGPNDTVVGIAASGGTPFVRAALGAALTRGAKTVLVACAEPPQGLRADCDVVIYLPTGPEVVTGSTRMKAGTATKLVLNTLTTAAMVRLGKTYGNLMVDLQAWSAKLIDRGERIVMEVTGVDRGAARAAIDAAGGSVRSAIVMAKTGLSRAEADARLAASDHRVRAVIGPPPGVPAR
ncbi:MAG: N-acetylmuramic acid 6-phosphate etherase [Gemmatimonadetes bacterium]|nr:N-acetylmuramic acid 6-phosphate etherase [Gemmatimonadota bacterium]